MKVTVRRPREPAGSLDAGRETLYDIRRSFASVMLLESKVSIVDLSGQLGHSPTMTLNTYGHVIAELREARRVSAIEQIQLARARFRGSAP
jgi:integrase